MQKPLDSSLIYRKKDTKTSSAPGGHFATLLEEEVQMKDTINYILEKIVEKHSA